MKYGRIQAVDDDEACEARRWEAFSLRESNLLFMAKARRYNLVYTRLKNNFAYTTQRGFVAQSSRACVNITFCNVYISVTSIQDYILSDCTWHGHNDNAFMGPVSLVSWRVKAGEKERELDLHCARYYGPSMSVLVPAWLARNTMYSFIADCFVAFGVPGAREGEKV